MTNLWKNPWYLIKFELSIFVIWSGLVDKVAVFQIAEYNSMVQIQPVPIKNFSHVTGFFFSYLHTVYYKAIPFLPDTFTYLN